MLLSRTSAGCIVRPLPRRPVRLQLGHAVVHLPLLLAKQAPPAPVRSFAALPLHKKSLCAAKLASVQSVPAPLPPHRTLRAACTGEAQYCCTKGSVCAGDCRLSFRVFGQMPFFARGSRSSLLLSKILPTAASPRARSTCCTRPPRSTQPHGVCRRPSALYRVFGRFGLVILPPARNLSGVRIVRNSLSSPTDNCCDCRLEAGGRARDCISQWVLRVYNAVNSQHVGPQGLRRPGCSATRVRLVLRCPPALGLA